MPALRQIWVSVCLFSVAAMCVALAACVPGFSRAALPQTMTIHSVSFSGDTGWAAGVISGAPNALLLHYSSGTWTQVTLPAGTDRMATLSAVTMVSPAEGWAVGQTPVSLHGGASYQGGLILHLSHGTWTVASPVARDALWAVAASAPDDVWAAGASGLVLHYDGTRWAEVPVPQNERNEIFRAVSVPTRGNVWVAGMASILHYAGQTWTTDHIQPAPGSVQLPIINTLSMTSADSGWASGQYPLVATGVLLRYVSGRWIVWSETPHAVNVFAARTASDIWAAGASGYVLHFDGTQWHDVSSNTRTPLAGMAVAHQGDVWVVGDAGTIVRYHGGTWQSVSDILRDA